VGGAPGEKGGREGLPVRTFSSLLLNFFPFITSKHISWEVHPERREGPSVTVAVVGVAMSRSSLIRASFVLV